MACRASNVSFLYSLEEIETRFRECIEYVSLFVFQGRFPFYLEPAVIVCITDGRKLTTSASVQSEVSQVGPQGMDK